VSCVSTDAEARIGSEARLGGPPLVPAENAPEGLAWVDDFEEDVGAGLFDENEAPTPYRRPTQLKLRDAIVKLSEAALERGIDTPLQGCVRQWAGVSTPAWGHMGQGDFVRVLDDGEIGRLTTWNDKKKLWSVAFPAKDQRDGYTREMPTSALAMVNPRLATVRSEPGGREGTSRGGSSRDRGEVPVGLGMRFDGSNCFLMAALHAFLRIAPDPMPPPPRAGGCNCPRDDVAKELAAGRLL